MKPSQAGVAHENVPTLNFGRARAEIGKCPHYRPTPLLTLTRHNEPFWLKDETSRFGLSSFKTLGAAYAVSQLLAKLPAAASCEQTFVCGSAGNHGVALAAATRQFGAHARVHLPSSAPSGFAAQIADLGGEVVWSGDDYEAALAGAALDAQSNGAVLLSDRAASADDEPSRLVMEGYTIIAEELRAAFVEEHFWPTHVFLQAGVGSFAAAVSAHVRAFWSEQPEIIIAEPAFAACLAAHAEGGGTISDTPSVMHRLDCKIPSATAIPILAAAGVVYASVSDAHATEASVELTELGVATTSSGAAGYAAWRGRANQHGGFRPLIFATERADKSI